MNRSSIPSKAFLFRRMWKWKKKTRCGTLRTNDQTIKQARIHHLAVLSSASGRIKLDHILWSIEITLNIGNNSHVLYQYGLFWHPRLNKGGCFVELFIYQWEDKVFISLQLSNIKRVPTKLIIHLRTIMQAYLPCIYRLSDIQIWVYLRPTTYYIDVPPMYSRIIFQHL